MPERMTLGNLTIEVSKKDIKNVHLSVHPPEGKVRVAAPHHIRMETLRVYVVSRLGWIKEQQRKFRAQERESEREFSTRESHYLWGRRYLLKVVEKDAAPAIEIRPRALILSVRPGSGKPVKQAILEKWYRDQIRAAVEPLLGKWEKVLGVKAGRIFVQRMRTRWGSCNPATKGIRFNSELSKKPAECLEYILVHELIHLLEPTHNPRFISMMNRFMPHWRHYRRELNRAPLAFEQWDY
ncbi:MAG: M48 family metallopeptidase [Fibrobacterota bacterium]|nr:M48 family metallopeptidase [Fibrobacterota bacterium]